jgi:hypothetical protein
MNQPLGGATEVLAWAIVSGMGISQYLSSEKGIADLRQLTILLGSYKQSVKMLVGLNFT